MKGQSADRLVHLGTRGRVGAATFRTAPRQPGPSLGPSGLTLSSRAPY